MLVTMKEILDRAQKENYAVPAPNVFYELETRAVLELAEELKSPIILDVFPTFGPSILDLAKRASVPVAINLDHGRTYKDIVKTIVKQASSVMVDRSMLSYEDNVKEVSEIVKIAHSVGISVEAELGHVGNGEQYDIDGKTALTVPDEAVRFVKETNIDALAIAIGTAHGVYSGIPMIHFDLLKEINDKVDIPLVLHGGSGTGFDNIKKACSMGINKVNVNTDLSKGAMNELKETIETGRRSFYFIDIANGYKKVLKQYMEACGCIGKAWNVEPKGISGEALMLRKK
ncbi:MAG: class II fructose-bisphosphate aldolase [Erysipelotrichaceae bacterium]|nr:class II fructose-bisphosphate aldolase [Erysipelotrichaceae bacterium]